MYYRANILLATKHQKEKAIEPVFDRTFKANIILPDNFDTDEFGTFTGEIPRQLSAYETVIKKAQVACEKFEFAYGMASEGSFGPHPTLFFCPGDIELISFIDREHEIIIVESEVTTKTNYSFLELRKGDDYSTFLQQARFPSHGLIVKSLEDNVVIDKGLQDHKSLSLALDKGFKRSQLLRLETDMRAMMNPTRMEVIGLLAMKLVNRLQQCCEQCKSPGFGKKIYAGNLPCALCGSETQLYKNLILSCVKCDFQKCLPREDGLIKANPEHCANCNP